MYWINKLAICNSINKESGKSIVNSPLVYMSYTKEERSYYNPDRVSLITVLKVYFTANCSWTG